LLCLALNVDLVHRNCNMVVRRLSAFLLDPTMY
jgi:hypothetical protein